MNKKDEIDRMEQNALSTGMALIFKKAEERYPIVEFALVFVHTELFVEYFTNHTIFSQSPGYVLQLFLEEISAKNIEISCVTEPQYDEDVAYWLGYLLADWKQEYNMGMSVIKKDHLEWLYNNYSTLHTQSTRYVYNEYVSEVLCKER